MVPTLQRMTSAGRWRRGLDMYGYGTVYYGVVSTLDCMSPYLLHPWGEQAQQNIHKQSLVSCEVERNHND